MASGRGRSRKKLQQPVVAAQAVAAPEKASVIDPVRAARSGALPYIPAIDGLRALAVAAVLLYHSGLGWLPGGFLGVEVFFVISGYLITSLLIAGHRSTGHVSLGGFWRRRARRLLPAAFTLIVATLVYSVIFLPGEVVALRGNAVAGFFYVSNWYQIFHSQSYFESLGRPSLLQHLWSLGVEEQFYLVWPVLFSLVLARIKPSYAFTLVLAGAIASSALMAYKFDPGSDPSRIYYGTDTRAGGLLFGAALAFVWQAGNLPARANRLFRRTVDVWGAVALIGLICFAATIKETDMLLYRGGFAIVGVATALVIAAAVHPDAGGLRRVLGRQPLLWLGTRSYSVYLWHWPVFMLTRPGYDVSADGVPLFALRLVITAVLAEASYRLVEMPVRRGAIGRLLQSLRQSMRQLRRPSLQPSGFRPLAATGFAGLGVVFLGVTVAAAGPPAPPSYLAVGEVHTVAWSRPATPSPKLATATPNGLTSALPRRLPIMTASPTPTPVPATATPEPAAPQTAAATPRTEPPSLMPVASPPPPLASPPQRVFALGDSVMLGAAPSLLAAIPNLEVDASVSRQVSAGIDILSARRDAGTLGDVVIIHLGTNGTFTSGQFDEMMGVLSGVQRVVFVNLKVPRDWESGDNSVIANGVSRYPSAVLVDWHNTGDAHPEFFYDDEIHLRPDGADSYAQLIAPDAQ
ncbi:MAG: acetyltransferase [Chloroflexota bacterium]|nr:acetyltransferase [Chloroflexota bacterium]